MKIKQDLLIAACTAYSIASGTFSVHVTAMEEALKEYERNKRMPKHKTENECCCERIKLSYSKKYDSFYCSFCNKWMEPKCSDKQCDFCSNRPDKPQKKIFRFSLSKKQGKL